MTIASIVLALLFIFWSFMTLITLMTVSDMYGFMRSVCFIILCVGYIFLLTIFTLYKKMRKQNDEW